MSLIAIITETQKNELSGQWYAPDSFFNPILDNNDNFVISEEEVNSCINPDFMWVKDLELSTYNPKPSPLFP